MFRRSSVLIAIVLMLCTVVALAATTSRMTGTVQDDQGLPLPGVTVQISSDKLIGGPQVVITDGNGSFVFNLLPPGLYTVEANLAGFRPAAGELQVALDRTANITFQMVPESFTGLSPRGGRGGRRGRGSRG